jgi:hypothetical protein
MVSGSASKVPVLDAPSVGSAARPGPHQGQPKQARKLIRPAIALMAVVAFQQTAC